MTKSVNDEFEEAALWDLPTVDEHEALESLKEAGATNALNRPRNRWKYEAPDGQTSSSKSTGDKEQETNAVKPLTAQEIDSIRTAAYQEGLLSGHTEGFDKGREEGFEKGHQEGLYNGQKEGVEQGKHDAKAQIDEQLQILQSLIDNIQQPLQEVNSELKDELVILAVNLSKAVIKNEVKQSLDTILKAVNEGISLLPINEAQYQFTLHPEDIACLHEHFGEQHIRDNNWQFSANEDMQRGGCKIQTSSNAIDLSIEKRCQQVFEQVLLNQGLTDDPRAS